MRYWLSSFVMLLMSNKSVRKKRSSLLFQIKAKRVWSHSIEFILRKQVPLSVEVILNE